MLNRDELIAGLPITRWQELDEGERFACTLVFIERMLNAIESEGRETDDWELENVGYALALLAGGMGSRSAVPYVWRSLNPIGERGPSFDKVPIPGIPERDELRTLLGILKSQCGM